jgi:thiol-disulfide isomerase/thioredoxin
MNFFNAVFDTYVFAGSRNIQGSDLRHAVNRVNSYHALMDSLGKDTILRNEVLRELVMLKALQSMHGNPDYRQQNVENILNYINTNSKFPEHRSVARNILFEKNNLVPGAVSPSIVVYDENDNPVRIPEDFQGKFIYLGFWASWCESCMLEFIALKELFDQYRDDIVFINISTERNPVIFDAYLNSADYGWLEFHFRHDFHILDAFKVRALPTFVLFDTNGNILDYPALKPSANVKQRFDRILNPRPGSPQR